MKCPHCLHLFHEQWEYHQTGQGPEGRHMILHQTCPGCGKSIVYLNFTKDGFVNRMLVYPKGSAYIVPVEVDDPDVIDDFMEAGLVLDDSPKASAALSRRCLQHILREKANVKKGDLNNEIEQVLESGKLPSDIAENLDAVRNIGNFAAHPIKSTSTGEIVSVEQNEAEWNMDVLEQIIDFYYVRPAIAKKKREELNTKLASAGKPSLK